MLITFLDTSKTIPIVKIKKKSIIAKKSKKEIIKIDVTSGYK
jgi:hypothetical protein